MGASGALAALQAGALPFLRFKILTRSRKLIKFFLNQVKQKHSKQAFGASVLRLDACESGTRPDAARGSFFAQNLNYRTF